ncbi:FxSxx-COOH system tetratricopeptide repeat protein [Nonomuraea sp. NPDC004297]
MSATRGEPGHLQPQPHVQLDAAASGQAKVYQAGRDQIVHQTTVQSKQTLRSVTELAALPRLVNVPLHTGVFVGRDDELAAMEAALRAGGNVVVAAVHGLGGVGKSTLAARYALTRAQDHGAGFNPVWWITAESAAAVQAGLADLAIALQPELATALPVEALAQRATAWLAAHDGWLLVLDNVIEPADVAPLLERIRSGQVLVTSRLSEGWHRLGARILRLDVLSDPEAVVLLTHIVASRLLSHSGPNANESENLDGANELVQELGGLPLAIEQAAAYLHQNRLSPRAYLRLLGEHPAVMYDQVAHGSDAERTIASIWRITLNRLAEVPLAGQLLRILAWYGADAIPRTLLDGLDISAPELLQGLGSLAAYNMISLDKTGITVHRLVQAVARTSDGSDPHRQGRDIDAAREQATILLNCSLPEEPEHPSGWSTWRMLLPHITALTGHATATADTSNTAQLLSETGRFLSNQGAITPAINSLRRATTAYQRTLGSDHSTTLTSLDHLATVYRAAGNLSQAIQLYKSTLCDRERVLGEKHPDTLTSRNNLAGAYEAAGNLNRAIPLYQSALRDRKRTLGNDHPATLASHNNLAGAFQAAGDTVRAILMFEATLADCERVLGNDHPYTLSSRNNLAGAYWMAGDLISAILMFEATLAHCERVLGNDHPDTIASRNNLAGAYQTMDDLDRAIPLFETALADCERVLGSDHPHTLSSRHNLASAYDAAGDPDRAISLSEVVLADCERVLGEDHLSTLTSRNNLAAVYEIAGDPGRAISLYEVALAECERVLGRKHSLTKTVRTNLELLIRSSGGL